MLAIAGCGDVCGKVADFFKSDSVTGFAIGFAAAVVLWLVFKCARALSGRKRAIVFEDNEKGTFNVTVSALADFVRKIASRYDMLSVETVKVYDTRDCTVMDIHVRPKFDIDVVAVRNRLRDDLFAEMSSKLGIVDQIGKINIMVDAFVTSDTKEV